MPTILQGPNLFIVGSMKCGTTSLHELLGRHPDIYMSEEPKEPNYFDRPANVAGPIERYLEIFRAGQGKKYIGESSTNYTKHPLYQGVPQRIYEFNPNAKVIYIVREPLARAISHYWWQVEWSAEGRGMLEVLSTSTEIVDVCNYAMQIRPYIEQFGRGNVHVLTLEELQENTEVEITRILTWLGLRPLSSDEVAMPKANASAATVPRVVGSGWLSKLKGGFFWNALKSAIPSDHRARLQRLLSRSVPRAMSKEQKAAVESYLQPIFSEQAIELERLLGRSFWRRGREIDQRTR